jgi:hypothetical protein
MTDAEVAMRHRRALTALLRANEAIDHNEIAKLLLDDVRRPVNEPPKNKTMICVRIALGIACLRRLAMDWGMSESVDEVLEIIGDNPVSQEDIDSLMPLPDDTVDDAAFLAPEGNG